MFGPGDRLEDEYREPFQAWKAQQTPQTNAALLKAVHPAIEGAVRAHAGDVNPLAVSRARAMTLKALPGYDPARSRMKTYLYNQLQGLRRVARQQGQVLKVPERVAFDRYHLENATQELTDRFGREPTDDELADHTGFSGRRIAKVRSYAPPVAEGTLEAANPDQMVFGGAGGPAAQRLSAVHDAVYGDLPPRDQLIFEWTLGYNGKRRLSNQQIAAKLGVSPGLVSQRKAAIQQMLDSVADAGVF